MTGARPSSLLGGRSPGSRLARAPAQGRRHRPRLHRRLHRRADASPARQAPRRARADDRLRPRRVSRHRAVPLRALARGGRRADSERGRAGGGRGGDRPRGRARRHRRHAREARRPPVRLDPGEHTVARRQRRGAPRRSACCWSRARRRALVICASAPPAPRRGRRPPPRPPTASLSAHGSSAAPACRPRRSRPTSGSPRTASSRTSRHSCSPHCSDAQTQPGRTDALVFDVFLGGGEPRSAERSSGRWPFPAEPGVELRARRSRRACASFDPALLTGAW